MLVMASAHQARSRRRGGGGGVLKDVSARSCRRTDRGQGGLGVETPPRVALPGTSGHPHALSQNGSRPGAKAPDVGAAIGSTVLRHDVREPTTPRSGGDHLRTSSRFAYFNASPASPDGPDYLALGGPGFRLPALAASNPEVWRRHPGPNREEIRKQTQRFRQHRDAPRIGARRQERPTSRRSSDDPQRQRGARGGWQMNSADTHTHRVSVASPPFTGPPRHVQAPLPRPAAALRHRGTGARAGLEEHLEPRPLLAGFAAADRHHRPAPLRDTRA